MAELEQEIKSILTSLVDSICDEKEEKNKELYTQLADEYKTCPSELIDRIGFALFDLEEGIRHAMGISQEGNAGIISYIVNGTYENFFKRLMAIREGGGCCADKSRFIVNQTIKALQTQTNVSLYANYENCTQIPEEEWYEQAYWSPRTLKDTDEAIKLFWDWYTLKTIDF